jgi:acetyltransferase-like isoleucine patch superfamily enzyme
MDIISKPSTEYKSFLAYMADNEHLPPSFEKFNKVTLLVLRYHLNPDENMDALFSLFAHVGKNVEIGRSFFCDMGENISIGHHVRIGDHVVVLDTCDVVIGNNVKIDDYVHIYTVGHKIRSQARWRSVLCSKVVIGNNVTIGERAVIFPGTYVGNDVVIEQGGVAKGVIPDGTCVVGNADIVDLHSLLEKQPLKRIEQTLSGENDMLKIPYLHVNELRNGLYYRNGHNIKGNIDTINVNVMLDDSMEIVLGEHCLIAPGVKIFTDISQLVQQDVIVKILLYTISKAQHLKRRGKITLGNNVWIGGNVIITPGVSIGHNAVILASNAVISQNILENTLVKADGNGTLVLERIPVP